MVRQLLNFLMDVNEPVPEGINRDIFMLLKSQFRMEEREKMENVIEYYRLGNSPNYAQLYAQLRGRVVQKWLFQPKAVKVIQNYVMVVAPNDFLVFIPNYLLAAYPIDLLANLGGHYMLAEVECRYKFKKWTAVARKVKIFKMGEDLKAAEAVCRDVPPIVALTIGMGWRPHWKLVRLNMVRFASNVKIGGDGIIPSIQLTTKGTGKTTHALFSQEALGYAYISKVPTLARLLVDARTGAVGMIAKKGIIFDEFTDLNSMDAARVEGLLATIKTGLDKGLWIPHTSVPKPHLGVIQKYVPLIWYGNDNTEPHDARGYLANWLKAHCKVSSPEAFLDRFALIDITINDCIEVADLITWKILPAKIMRGIITLVKKRAESKPLAKYVRESTLKGRLKQMSARVRATFEALLSTDTHRVNFKPKEIDEIVAYNNWGEVRDFLKEYVTTSISGL